MILRFKKIDAESLVNIIAAFKKETPGYYNNCDFITIEIGKNIEIDVNYSDMEQRFITIFKNDLQMYEFANRNIKIADIKNALKNIL